MRGASRRAGGRGADDVGELHGEAEELRHRHQQVDGRAVRAQHMDVGEDDVRREAAVEHRPADVETEAAHAVTDVEDDAQAARRFHFRAHLCGRQRHGGDQFKSRSLAVVAPRMSCFSASVSPSAEPMKPTGSASLMS